MGKNWWKILAVILLYYATLRGLTGPVPQKAILDESIRNLYFHVPMWFTMITLLAVSVVYSIRFLYKGNEDHDDAAVLYAGTALFFGLLGLLTGMIWAKNTWGAYWTPDPKLNGVAVGMLVYLAYLVLRSAIPDREKRARISAVYNIFAFPVFLVLIFMLKEVDSLHPGNGGNPGFNAYDLDNRMRLVFYPAVLGWILLAVWIAEIRVRTRKLENILKDN